MTKITDNLLKDENLTYSSHMHWIIFSTPCLTALFGIIVWVYLPAAMLLADLVLVVAAVMGVIALISFASAEYHVTDQRVIMQVGIFQRHRLEVYLNRVESIQTVQSIVGGMLDYGTVAVIGVGGTRDMFNHVRHPLVFRRHVEELLSVIQR